MAVDFPNSPAVGDIFSVGYIAYKWTGSVWQRVNMNAQYTPNVDGGMYNANFGGVSVLNAGSP